MKLILLLLLLLPLTCLCQKKDSTSYVTGERIKFIIAAVPLATTDTTKAIILMCDTSIYRKGTIYWIKGFAVKKVIGQQYWTSDDKRDYYKPVWSNESFLDENKKELKGYIIWDFKTIPQ